MYNTKKEDTLQNSPWKSLHSSVADILMVFQTKVFLLRTAVHFIPSGLYGPQLEVNCVGVTSVT